MNLTIDKMKDITTYNGEPLKDGEILVPQIMTREDARMIQAQCVRTWTKCGVKYTVIFVAVPAEKAEVAMRAFNADLRDLLDEKLGPNRTSRCMVPQADGSLKPCPREVNGKANLCTGCPMRGKLEKEDKSVVSLDALMEEEYYPMVNAPSAESCAMLGFLLEDLLEEFESKCPQSAEIVRLGFAGLERKEIVQRMPQQKTQAYDAYNKCRRDVERFLRK